MIADRIVGQLNFNREGEGRERLRHEVRRIRRRLAHNHSDIAVNALGMNLWWFSHDEDPSRRDLWAELIVLDDLLEPYTVREDLGGRRRSSNFRCHIAAQKRRRAVLDRVKRDDGILEIDLMAEHAIVASGRTIARVITSLQENRDMRHGVGETMQLWHEVHGDEVAVCVRDGRIELVFRVGSVRTMTPGHLEIGQVWPSTVSVGLAGQELGQLIGHPLLKPDAIIVQMTTDNESRSYVELEQQYRIVRSHEMESIADEDDLPF